MMKKLQVLKDSLFSEEYDVQHRFLNVALLALFLAGFICFWMSVILGLSPAANMIIAVVDVVLGFSAYFSIVKKKTKAALILTCIVDLVSFPYMYFMSGGMISGMPIWFVVSLVIFWLILRAPYCFIMYGLNAVILISCFVVEMKFPDIIDPIETRGAVAGDMIQCMLVVSGLLGLIIKYQTHIYEVQRKNLERQTIELRETMQALESANEAKTEFLTNMSHEIRTPINAIIGMNEIILRECKSENIIQYATSVQNAGGILLDYVNNILDFSKIESGVMEIEEDTYKFSDLVAIINRIIEPQMRKKGLEYKLTIDENIPEYLKGDNYKISCIASHLLTNAVKYTEKGYVALTFGCGRVDYDKLELIISVADTGVGIPEESLSNLFSGFNRIELNKHRNIEGLGLGLAVTKHLTELMGGTIEVKSVYGSGSMFTVTIPQAAGEPAETNKPAEIVDEDPFIAPHAKILAVDDNKVNLEVIKHLLKKYEIEIDLAASGDECIRLCSNKCYDLIFMDHMMPSPDGIETMRILHSGDNLNRDTPVMVVTANAIKGAREEYLKEGFVDYLSKPINTMALETAIRNNISPELIEKKQPEEIVEPEKTETEEAAEANEWIDKQAGLEYFANDEEFYKEILVSYYEQLKKYRPELPALVDRGDWKNYTVIVHSLKSTSMNIGASGFSAMAREQELLGKANNADEIRKSFDEFIRCYDEVFRTVEKMIGIEN